MQKTRMNKRAASMYVNVILTVLVLFVVLGGIGLWQGWFVKEAAPAPTGAPPPSKAGDLASLKYSVESVSGNSRIQYAGTGYCWDQAEPNMLIETTTGKTLSATAGTSFAPTTRGSTYECTAFDSSSYCDHASGPMVKEGLSLRSNCYNLSTIANLAISLYEDNTVDGAKTLDLGSEQTNTFNKFMIELNTSNKYYPLKAICLGSNGTPTNVKSMEIKGWKKDDTVPDSLDADADDECFVLDEAFIFDEWRSHTFENAIVFEADTTGTGTTEEAILMTFHDECEYLARDGSIKKDWFERDTDDENDCGLKMINTTIYLT